MHACKKLNLSCLLALTFITGACNDKTTTAGGTPGNPGPGNSRNFLARLDEDNLTQEAAVKRRAQVESLSYAIHLIFKKGSPDILGKTTLKAKLFSAENELSIDYAPENILSLNVNGKAVTNFVSRKGSLDVPAENLVAGDNLIVIEHKLKGENNGDGMIYFKDTDDKEYFYSQFEPFSAHRVFPSLDQPDIKATYDITLTVPREWKAISNALPSGALANGENMTVSFATSESISTYLAFFGAGDWTEWDDTFNGLPLKLYTRQSLAKYVDEKNIFDITKKALGFYSDYFGHAYPFQKLGQIFAPNFAIGGMENAGAITYTDEYLFRGPVSARAVDNRANVIMHEIAHQWFGDLVTMKWWDGLWLNESFATFMATLAQEHTGSKEAWDYFFANEKTWGYSEDNLVTTHPIQGLVPDAQSSFASFDGITYAKGASSLRQLNFYVGEDAFRDGIRNYFKKNAWGNTTLPDFLGEIAAASGKDLSAWSKGWLESAGPNAVAANFSCENDLVKEFTLTQGPNRSGLLLPHKTKVALYKKDEHGTLLNMLAQDVEYSTEQTAIAELVGKPCPDFVNPNFEDRDFANFSYDAKSLETAKTYIAFIPEALSRLQALYSMTEMLKDAKLAALDYAAIVANSLSAEKEIVVLDGNRRTISSAYWTWLTTSERDQMSQSFEKIIDERLAGSAAGSFEQITWVEYLQALGRTPGAVAELNNYLSGQLPAGFTLSPGRRWDITSKLIGLGEANPTTLIETQLTFDNSTTSQDSAYASAIAIPTAEAKESAWKKITTEDLSLARLNKSLSAFNHPDHPELTANFVDRYFEFVGKTDWEKESYKIDSYFERLFPWLCTEAYLKQSQDELAAQENKLPFAAVKIWKQQNDNLQRCVKRHLTTAGQ